MLFNSFVFILLFFPVVLGVGLKLRGPSLIRWLTCASFVFYAFAGHRWFLIPMLFTTTLDFFLGQKIEEYKDKITVKKTLLVISLIGNLGLLFYFKYSGLFVNTGEKLLEFFYHGTTHSLFFIKLFDVTLPAGISFYTFQTLSYIIDVYRGSCPAERNFWKFACFVSFFPHLIAGPLTRHDQLIPQLNTIEEAGVVPRWQPGIYLFAVGLSKKVLIADRIANLIDPLLTNVAQLHLVTAWLVALGYAFQIYFDFSGYSDMAIGLGRLLGIELPQNFNSPYKALNPSDFWSRWHITLSRWLRDYLYISLGGNRCSKARRNFNLMVTMTLGGFWHGANWRFIGWGFFHGSLLIIYHRFQRQWDSLPILCQRIMTFVLVCIGWVFFRATTFTDAFTWLHKMFDLREIGTGDLSLYLNLFAFNIFALFLANYFRNASSYTEFENLSKRTQFSLGLTTVLALIFMNYSSRFLYFQF